MSTGNASPLGSRRNSQDDLSIYEHHEENGCSCSLTNLLSTIAVVVGAILLTIGMVALYTHFFPTTLPFLTKTVVSSLGFLKADLLTFSVVSSLTGILLVAAVTMWQSRVDVLSRRKLIENL